VIPDKHEQPVLYTAVLQTNIYYCNYLTRAVSCCNRNSCCVYSFPQPVAERTTLDRQGCVYFRRCTEEDGWVVLYIPSLLLYINCYIHIDVCSNVTVFIYLYKYLFKGPDQARFRFETATDRSISAIVDDEFYDYISSCYLLSSEAVYRILSFNITSKRPPIQCLPVYLENTQLG
jgi:hypothetical protein